MRLVSSAAATGAACLLLAAAAWSAGGSADLNVAREALQRNLALGESLAGKSVAPEQAAEAGRLLREALGPARALVAAEPRKPEGHHLVGLALCLGYQPVESKAVSANPKTGEKQKQVLIVLRQGREGASEEGLAELRSAMRLAPRNVDYRLDYSEALQASGQAETSVDRLTALWGVRGELSPTQQARTAKLLSRAMRLLERRQEEVRWLREALTCDPRDVAVAERLNELAPASAGGIVWLKYEAGMAAAQREQKPVWIDFSTSWCGWCPKLEKEVFTDPAVIEISRKFVCIKVDGDRRRDLIARHRVPGYPTAVLLDSSGRELHRIVGYRAAPAYLAELQRVAGGS